MRNHGLSYVDEEIAGFREEMDRFVAVKGPGDYVNDPVGYARDILEFEPAPAQIEVANALREYPHRVLAPSGHKYGKSALAGWLINWFYDSYRPSLCVSTAPKFESVKNIVWKEVRRMRMRAGLSGLQPKSPEMADAPDHAARGMTASSGEGFQGQHEARSFYVFDEACGIDPVIWQVTHSMFKPEQGHMWLALFNPTDPTSQAWAEDHSTDNDGNPRWRRVQMDCLEHPNVLAQLQGLPPPIPAAVTLPMISEWLYDYGCELISKEDAESCESPSLILEWPPGSGIYYKQGPEFQARCRGIWPEGDTYAIWSQLLLKRIEMEILSVRPTELPELGCDVARFGDDYTAFHVRWGDVSQYHQAANGWDTERTADRIASLCELWASNATLSRPAGAVKIKPEQILVKIDDDGVGGGVTDKLRRKGIHVIPVGAGTVSLSGRYPNKRSELWFQTMERARAGRMSIAKLNKPEKNRLRQQFMQVTWGMNGMGLRVVEPKEYTKLRLGRSPDDADACNLAFYETAGMMETAKYIDDGKGPREPYSIPNKSGRKIWG